MNFPRTLMSASALVMFALGLMASFAPDFVLRSIDVPESAVLMLLVQVMGGLYLGFAALNWMGRNNLIGGIYSRPVAVANLMHFLTGGIAMLKLVFTQSVPSSVMAAAVVYAVFAVAFGFILGRHPIRPAAQPGSAV